MRRFVSLIILTTILIVGPRVYAEQIECSSLFLSVKEKISQKDLQSTYGQHIAQLSQSLLEALDRPLNFRNATRSGSWKTVKWILKLLQISSISPQTFALELLDRIETNKVLNSSEATHEISHDFYNQLVKIDPQIKEDFADEGVINAISTLILAKVFQYKSGDDRIYNSVRSSLSMLEMPLSFSDFQLRGLTRTEIIQAWDAILSKNNKILKSEDVHKAIDEVLANGSALESTFKTRDGIQIQVLRSDTPDKIASLPPEVLKALKKLDSVYKSQPSNTYDLLAEQTKNKGKLIYYMVATEPSGEFAGLFAVVIGSKASPTNLSKFGIENSKRVQIEFGNILILKSGRNLFRDFMRTSLSLLKSKGVSDSSQISFWADEPVWAKGLIRMGAPQIPTELKGVWAFRVPFDKIYEKFHPL